MSVPTITAHTDPIHRIVTVSVAGPLLTVEHTKQLSFACGGVPHWYGLLIDITAVTSISDTGMHALRDRARLSAVVGQRLVFVCSELMLRAELILADLDTLAPVLDSADDAVVVAAMAA
jgi:anti-anti-sigma regulatory factor